MFCKNCGTENDDNAKFCRACGQPLENETATQEQSSVQDNAAQVEPQPAPAPQPGPYVQSEAQINNASYGQPAQPQQISDLGRTRCCSACYGTFGEKERSWNRFDNGSFHPWNRRSFTRSTFTYYGSFDRKFCCYG